MKLDTRRFTRPSRPRGFTLVEILIVISIIVILVATVMAIGTNIRAGAQIRQTKLTLTTLQAALDKYINEGNAQPGDNSATDFVGKFRSTPDIWKVVEKLPTQGSGASVSFNDGFGTPIKYFTGNSTSAGAIKNQSDKNGYFVSGGPDGIITAGNAWNSATNYSSTGTVVNYENNWWVSIGTGSNNIPTAPSSTKWRMLPIDDIYSFDPQ